MFHHHYISQSFSRLFYSLHTLFQYVGAIICALLTSLHANSYIVDCVNAGALLPLKRTYLLGMAAETRAKFRGTADIFGDRYLHWWIVVVYVNVLFLKCWMGVFVCGRSWMSKLSKMNAHGASSFVSYILMYLAHDWIVTWTRCYQTS